MALDHLTGNRFAAFKEVNGQYIGTGKFIVQSEGPDKLTLVPQPYSEVKNKISLEFIPPQKIGDAITKGQIDCIPYIQGTMVNGVFDPHEIQVIAGQEASHMALNINNLTGRLFNKLELRKALQSLVWQKILDGSLSQINSPFFQFDAQVFMDGQTGRIDQTVVEKIINEGRDWIPDLISETQKHPLLVFAHEGAKGVFEVFKNLNLPIVDDSRVVDQKTFLENVYKEFKPDILIGAFSIANGDPDGIYHRLGKNGAILSPMSFSSSVGDLLEEGRKIIDISKLDSHYKKVSEKILEDVPFVHLGFSKAVAIVRKDKVNFNTLTLRRNEGHLEVFELK
jgi:ABC-type transport system substrate-binding protein